MNQKFLKIVKYAVELERNSLKPNATDMANDPFNRALANLIDAVNEIHPDAKHVLEMLK